MRYNSSEETKLPPTTKADDELIALRKRKALGVLTLKELSRLTRLESKQPKQP